MKTFDRSYFENKMRATNEINAIYQTVILELHPFMAANVGKKLYTSSGVKTAKFKHFYYKLIGNKNLNCKIRIELVEKSLWLKFGSEHSSDFRDLDIFIGLVCDDYQVLERIVNLDTMLFEAPTYTKKDVNHFAKRIEKLYTMHNYFERTKINVRTPKTYYIDTMKICINLANL